jgi:hypothetical protein
MEGCRLEVCAVENGYTVTVWETEEDGMYPEREVYVAKDTDEVLKLVKEHLS